MFAFLKIILIFVIAFICFGDIHKIKENLVFFYKYLKNIFSKK